MTGLILPRSQQNQVQAAEDQQQDRRKHDQAVTFAEPSARGPGRFGCRCHLLPPVPLCLDPGEPGRQYLQLSLRSPPRPAAASLRCGETGFLWARRPAVHRLPRRASLRRPRPGIEETGNPRCSQVGGELLETAAHGPFTRIGRRGLAWSRTSIRAWHPYRRRCHRRGGTASHASLGSWAKEDLMISHLNSGPGGTGGDDRCCTSA